MKVISGIIRVLSRIVYVIIILALLIAAPMLFGNRPVIVLSGSMKPDYPVGSVTYYKKAAFAELSVGDTITFKIGDNSLATHRIVAIDAQAQAFTTKGDNNDTQDANQVSYQAVQGKTASFAIPYAGYFINYVQKWQAIVACGLVLLLGMIFDTDKKKSANNKNDSKEKDSAIEG